MEGADSKRYQLPIIESTALRSSQTHDLYILYGYYAFDETQSCRILRIATFLYVVRILEEYNSILNNMFEHTLWKNKENDPTVRTAKSHLSPCLSPLHPL